MNNSEVVEILDAALDLRFGVKDEGAKLLGVLEIANLTIEQGWSDNMEAAREAGIVDLWAKERDRYEHDRIPDCLYYEGMWVHEQTIHDDDSLTNTGGFVEVLDPTHWRPRPVPPMEGTPAEGVICAGCDLTGLWEHRCHGGSCSCPSCRELRWED